ncbi:hypothetical protein [Peterkaempfera griseoplana]|uniref:hypothetical protein n=1 Tax=Peterkaempfera griseoplana TaxID=66896 RepID=UPI0006E143EC|nr:hypothetical protein [Peterkaempfera griseoplana]
MGPQEEQIGGSIGTALLNTIAARATADYLASRHSTSPVDKSALVHGYAVAYWWAAGFLSAAAFIAFFAVDVGRPSTQKAVAAHDDLAALDLRPTH